MMFRSLESDIILRSYEQHQKDHVEKPNNLGISTGFFIHHSQLLRMIPDSRDRNIKLQQNYDGVSSDRGFTCTNSLLKMISNDLCKFVRRYCTFKKVVCKWTLEFKHGHTSTEDDPRSRRSKSVTTQNAQAACTNFFHTKFLS